MTADRILILGATGGVGAALARRVAARGARPVLFARDAVRLGELATTLPGAESTVVDVTDAAGLNAAILALGAPLAGLAFCVGSILLKPLSRISEAELLEAFSLNAVAAALAVQAAMPALVEGKGSVVLFSSVAARVGFTNHLVVAAAKAAVEGMVVAMAAELAPAVRVNCIAPSLTRTRMAEPLTKSPAMAEGIAKLHPLPRLGEAEDIAAMADMLLSPASGWITGQVIAVDGGRSTVHVKAS